MRTRAGTVSTLVLLFGVVAATSGCATVFTAADTLPPVALPKDKVQVAQATDRIKVGDRLEMRLPDEPTTPLNAIYGVMPDGTIMLPGEGRVQVAGKTLEEARQALRNALTVSYALQTIELTPYEFYMVRVMANNDVQKVVRVPMRDGITVKAALKGAPPLANKVVWIVRPGGDRSGKDQVLTVDWSGIERGDKDAKDFALQRGDYLFVAEKPPTALERFFSITSADAPRDDCVANGNDREFLNEGQRPTGAGQSQSSGSSHRLAALPPCVAADDRKSAKERA